MEEQAFLSLRAGDPARARAQVDRLLELRPTGKDDLPHYAATLARGRIMLAQRDYAAAAGELNPALEYFHQRGLYYYEAQACMSLPACELEAPRQPPILQPLPRDLALAAVSN